MRGTRWVGAVALSCVLVLAGCGDDGDRDADEPRVSNPPERELASLIGDQGALRYRLTAEDATDFVTVILAQWGLDAADRECSAAAVAKVLSPDAEGRVTLARLGRVANRLGGDTDFAKQVAACSSPGSTERHEAQEAAPDLDLSGFMDLSTRTAHGQAAALGFTEEEATCYARVALDGVEVEQFARALVGYEDSQGASPVDAITECLEPPRIRELVRAGRALKTEYEACIEAQSKQQADALADALNSSTTAPGATTTTLPPCA